MRGERRDQAIPPPAVDTTCSPHVAIVVATGQELCERELVEGWGELVEEVFRPHHVIDEMCRHDEPTKSQAWSQCFRYGADLHNVLRRNTLQRTHRFTVVAELSIVVVFDDQPTVRARPRDQLATSLLAQDAASWELVRRRDEHSVGVKAADDHPLAINRL